MIDQRIHTKLVSLYGRDAADRVLERLDSLMRERAAVPRSGLSLSERDVMLIVYGDHVQRSGESPLKTLHSFLSSTVNSVVNCVHILPFYPYSSDDGFSVIDYRAVSPVLGSWDDIQALGRDFRLMFDAVFNHISAQSAWFQAFLRGEQPYTDYFHVVSPESDLSQVVRPRTLPLLTPFETVSGRKHVWTTFSADQIDLNFANPDVLLDMLDILLFYVEQGAEFIRLDAIAFLWKTIGTPCIHLPETHRVIQLIRDVLDVVAPQTILITETNVPHVENISYFGDGTNEAQLVYNFALPPLLLHTLHTGDARALTRWASSLERVGDRTTFFNFTASHDGIGIRPAVGILSEAEIASLINLTLDHGGFVSYRNMPDGSQSPYELNITYFDAITHPDLTAQQPDTAVMRFMVSQAIPLVLMGMPGIYFSSLYGSRNDVDAVYHSGQNRRINRQKFDADRLLRELRDPTTLRYRVFEQYRRLLRVRTAQPAFHPLGAQRIHDLHPSLFVAERYAPDGEARVLAAHNVSDQSVTADLSDIAGTATSWRDLLTGTSYPQISGFELKPYQTAWLTPI